jgi:hypothetical protein
MMKRALMLTVPLLMILTSLNAGTLAIYTSTIDLAVLPVSAKRFALGVNQGSTGEFDLQIAPGDVVSYNFDVSNTDSEGRVSQVDMDMLVEADFSTVYEALPGMRVKLLLQSGSNSQQVAECDSTGRLSYSQSMAFVASNPAERQFSLSFNWEDSEAARAVVMAGRAVLPLSVYIRGVQHAN